jgi:tellurite resistance protein
MHTRGPVIADCKEEESEMATLEFGGRAAAGSSTRSLVVGAMLAVPPTFFSITMGLAGLAAAWHLAADLSGVPSGIGNILYVVTAIVYLLLIGALAARLVLRPRSVAAELAHPVLGPFYSLVAVSGMLLALGLEPHAHEAAKVLFLIFLAATVLLGGWLTGRWIAGPLDNDSIHPGYFLPTVAGGLVGGQVAAAFGLTGVGWMSFGIGVLCWLLLGSLVLNRLFIRPALPATLIPTMAIEVAPPAVAGNAYAALTGGRLDGVAYALAGYTVLMVLVQIRLLPMYRPLSFAPSFWAFTFAYAAVATNTMRWIDVERPAGATLLGYAVLGIITLFIGAIAARSLVALQHGRFMPVPTN